jgi:hypothetical protein
MAYELWERSSTVEVIPPSANSKAPKSYLKKCIDERSDGRTLGEDDKKAEDNQEDEHRHQPPEFPLPEETQQL